MMNGSTRYKNDSEKIYDCYCEIGLPIDRSVKGSFIKRRYPDSFKDEEILKSVPQFAYPCNVIVSNVTNFSFVLTNGDSKWTFGYCRLAPNSDTCLVLLSQLPWHDTFYKILNHIALIYSDTTKQADLLEFLRCLHTSEMPTPGASFKISYFADGKTKDFLAFCPDTRLIPTIPQDRNLTEYFSAVEVNNMITIFASMLHERRILVTSKRLDRLSSCVQAANSLIYPMNWQHIYIPILPSHLVGYVTAPMPFLIGVPDDIMKEINPRDIVDVVILRADHNIVETPFDDLHAMPNEVTNCLKRNLKSPLTIGDSVAKAFLKAIVMLIGGYREALQFNGREKITFNYETFVKTRPLSVQPFLQKMLHLQIFRQFIEGRLEMLNAGEGFNDEFEFEVNLYEDRSANLLRSQYQDWLLEMKGKSGVFLRSINPVMRLAYKNVKDRSKRTFSDLKTRINESTIDKAPFLYHRMN